MRAAMSDIDDRRCAKCEEAKPLGDYYRHPSGPSGHMTTCKDCHKKAVTLRRRTNPAVQEYDRKRGNRQPKGYVRTYRERNPEAYFAHTAIGNALRDGRLTKGACLFCEATERIHGHHRDYSKPLDVVWLCAKCHHRLHATFPETAAHEHKP